MHNPELHTDSCRASGWRLPVVVGMLGASVLIIASLLSTAGVRHAARGAIDQEVRDNLSRLATMASSTIDGEGHRTLKSADQEESALYRVLNAPLTAAIQRTKGVRFVYTLRQVGDELCFVLDGTPPGDSDNDGVEDHSSLMEVYEDPDPAALESLRTGAVVITDEPYTDLWGTFLSGYAPIVLEDGTVDGVVGVDVSVDQYQARLARVDSAAMWALVPGTLLSVIVGFGAWWVTRRFVCYADEIVHRREEAVEANNAKSSLLANISHELRTPLNAIIGFVNLADDKKSSELERADARGTIKHNAEHLLTLINDLLDISKAEAGVISIEPTEIDLPELIERAVSPLRLRAAEKQIEFFVEGIESLPSRVVIDRTRVRQVMLNLLSNAVKFTDEGRVTLVLETKDNTLVMRVCDTGPGMSPEEVAILFTPFTQVGTREKRLQGTGLGLAISRHLTELMGGKIGVESTPGVGSVFTARIPFGEVELPDENTTQNVRADWELLNGANIAIAEDGQDNMRLLKMILKRAGASADGYTDGEEARAAVLESPDRYDLLITDWDMPILCGEGLVRKLREAGWTRPIVSLTAHAMPEQGQVCLRVGCDAHMTKPINAKKLIETCAALIEQHGQLGCAA